MQAAVVLAVKVATSNITISVHCRKLALVAFENTAFICHRFFCILVFRFYLYSHYFLAPQVFAYYSRRARGGVDPKQLVTISYKEKGRVPVVAHVPTHPVTFREFRKYLGISSKSSLQLVFAQMFNICFFKLTKYKKFCYLNVYFIHY